MNLLTRRLRFRLIAVLVLLSSPPGLLAAPYSWTQSATEIRSLSAKLNGMAVPNGASTLAWFEWGPRGSYGQTVGLANVGVGTAVVRKSAAISNLLAGSAYQFRLVTSNATGVAYGAMQLFTTGSHVTTWGFGGAGETNVPAGLSNAVAVTGGWQHFLALKADGTVVGWGDNGYNQTTVPTGMTNAVAIAAGYYHSLALTADGTVQAWGDYRYLQLQVPANLSNVIAIAAGGYHSAALRSDGTAVAWSYDPVQTNTPDNLSNVVAIASGAYHTIALKADGSIVVWGANDYGQTNVPAGLRDVIAIGAGE